MGHYRPLFFFIFVFSIQLTVNKCSINFADDWIRTADLWYRKRPLYQLSHTTTAHYLLLASVQFGYNDVDLQRHIDLFRIEVIDEAKKLSFAYIGIEKIA